MAGYRQESASGGEGDHEAHGPEGSDAATRVQELEFLFHAMPAPVIVYDEQGRAVRANPAAVEAYGIDPTSIGRLEVAERFATRREDGRRVPSDELASTRALRGETVKDDRFVFTNARGEERTILASASPLWQDQRVCGAVMVWHDITAQERAMQLLGRTNERLQTILDTLPVGVFVAEDPDCRVVLPNRAGAAMTGVGLHGNVSASAPAGERPPLRYFAGGRELQPEELPLQVAVAENRPVQAVELEVQMPSGRCWIAQANAAPLHDEDGQVVGGVAVLTDITEQVRTGEELLAVERARTEMAQHLAGEISHRVKNNLTMVAGLLQLQAEQLAPTDTTRALLRNAIARIRTFVVLYEQSYRRQSEEVELVEAVRRIAEIDRAALGAGDVVVSVEGESALYAFETATNLSLAANELITNAIKHGAPDPAGRLHVEVRAVRREGRLVLSVWNSGHPIASGFDPARVARGGLSFVRGIVDYYGGALSLTPARGGTLAEVVIEEQRLQTPPAVAPRGSEEEHGG